MTENYKVAEVVMIGGYASKKYSFKLFDARVSVNDLVLCDTTQGY